MTDRPRAGRARVPAAAVAAFSLMLPAVAPAQIIDQSTIVLPPRPLPPSPILSAFSRDRDYPVAEHVFRAFSATGVKIGNFDLFPGLMVAPEFISNIYANNADRHSAAALLIRPELTIRNRSGPVDAELFGRGAITRVAKFQSENTEEVVGGTRIEAEVGPLATLSAGASYGSRVLPRYASDSPTDAAKPLEYKELLGNLGGQIESGRVRATFRGDYARLSFENAPSTAGGTLLTHDRNREVLSGIARADYAFKPDTSVYVAATANHIEYSLPLQSTAINRDSKGYGVFIGTSFDVTGVLRADARVGYIRQSFDANGAKPISGLGLLGNLVYFPSRLTTVTLRGDRSVRDTGVPGTLGNLHTGGELQVDHELRRYFTATAIAGYATDDYRGTIRKDHSAYAAISALYLSGNHWSAKLGYQYNRRHCSCTLTGAQFDDHRVLFALTLQR